MTTPTIHCMLSSSGQFVLMLFLYDPKHYKELRQCDFRVKMWVANRMRYIRTVNAATRKEVTKPAL
jgi:hypothetical protein